jgi:phage/plasmid-associated DNA primase
MSQIIVDNKIITGSVDVDVVPTNLKYYSKILEILLTDVGENNKGYTIQVNGQHKSTHSDRKPAGDRVNGGSHSEYKQNGIYWYTFYDVSLNVIRRLIEHGFVTRFGVKLNGTGYKKHFVSCDFVYADIDYGQTIQQTLDDAYVKEHGCLVYRTPSFTEDNQKHRILFRLSETIKDPVFVYAVYLYLLELFPYFDKSIKDPSRIMYGSLEAVVYQNDDAFIDCSELASNDLFQKFYTIADVATNGNRNTEATYTASNGYQSAIIEKLANTFEWDLNELFKALGEEYDYGWYEIPKDIARSTIKYAAKNNPFSETNKSGSSLVATVMDGKLLFYARNGAGGSSLFDFLDCRRLELKQLLAKSLDRKRYFPLLKEVCEKLDIEYVDPYDHLFFSFDEKTGKHKFLPNIFVYHFIQNYKASLEYSSDTKRFHWYDTTFNYWSSVDVDMVRIYAREHLKSLIGDDLAIAHLTAKALTDIGVCLKSPDNEIIVKGTLEHTNTHIPFANGLFNLETKELEAFTPNVRNTFVLKHEYQPSTGIGIRVFRELFGYILENVEALETLIQWLTCYAQYKGHKTRQALGLVGTPNSGKSTLTEWLTRMYEDCDHIPVDSIVAYEKVGILTKKDNQFSNAALATAKCLIMTEFNGIPTDSDGGVLKDLIGMNQNSLGAVLTFETKKVHGRYKKLVNLAVITNSQEFPMFPVKDKGWDRRFLWIKFQVVKQHLEQFDLVNEHFIDLHAWLIEQINVSEILTDIVKARELAWAKAASNEMKVDQDKQYRFMDECLEFIDDRDIGIETSDLYAKYVHFCQINGEKYPLSSIKFSKEIRGLLAHKYNWEAPRAGERTSKDYVKLRTTQKYTYLRIKYNQECEWLNDCNPDNKF